MTRKTIVLFCADNRAGAIGLRILVDTKLVCAMIICGTNENSALVMLARDEGIPVIWNPKFDSCEDLRIIEKFNAWSALSVSYPKLIPKKVLALFPGGGFNAHPAKLPDYRGCYPTIWPIIHFDTEAWYTLHLMSDRFDDGPVLDKVSVPISREETGSSLYSKLLGELPHLISRNLPEMLRNEREFLEHDGRAGQYYPKKLPNNGYVDWSLSADDICRFVRALYDPEHICARTAINGVEIELFEVKRVMNQPGIPYHGCVEIESFDNPFLGREAVDAIVMFEKIRVLKTGKIYGADQIKKIIFC